MSNKQNEVVEEVLVEAVEMEAPEVTEEKGSFINNVVEGTKNVLTSTPAKVAYGVLGTLAVLALITKVEVETDDVIEVINDVTEGE